MKRVFVCMAAVLAVAIAGPAVAAEFEVHGDFNNRFNLYTNQAQMFSGVESVQGQPLDEDGIDEFFADFKYRMNATAATNDGNVKGVLALEVGGEQYGGSAAADFSGDGIDFEVRKAYTDFQLPGVQNKARFSLGLQPMTVNKFVWWEMVPSVQLKGDTGAFGYKLAWARGFEAYNDDEDDDLLEDLDSFLVRGDFEPAESTNAGLFLLYQRSDSRESGDVSDFGAGYLVKQFGASEFDLYTIGTDGSFTTPTSYGNAFLNWDLIYQGGSGDFDDNNDFDVSGYLLHADAGISMGKARLTYTGWYSSGDDDPTDGDIENFLATDVDHNESIIFNEGGYTDDDYFTETFYMLDKGLIFNKLALDYKATEKTDVGAAILYLMTAEDLEYVDDNGVAQSEDTLGTEIDAYVKHMLYPNVEVALNAGYLLADDGMDFWEASPAQDGSSDTDVFRSTMRVRYKF